MTKPIRNIESCKRLTWPCVVAALATACGGVVTSGNGNEAASKGNDADGATGGSAGSAGASNAGGTVSHAPLGPPDSHRAVASVCPSDRPPTTPVGIRPVDAGSAQSGPDAPCYSDADCSQGINGRCDGELRTAPLTRFCSYDECLKDGDCAGQFGACVCEVQTGLAFCVSGNCRVDADCGPPGYCSLSTEGEGCQGGIVPMGYFCHTIKDECTSDADCASHADPSGLPLTHCAFESTLGNWACTYLDLCNG